MDASPLSCPVGYGPKQLSKHLWRHLTPSLHRSNLSILSSHVYAHTPQLSRLAANLPLLSPHQWDVSKQKDRKREAAALPFPCSFPSFSSAGLPPPTRAALLRPHTPPHLPTNLLAITPAHLALPPTQCCRNQLPNPRIKCRHYTMDCISKPRITQVELRAVYRPPPRHCLKRPHCA